MQCTMQCHGAPPSRWRAWRGRTRRLPLALSPDGPGVTHAYILYTQHTHAYSRYGGSSASRAHMHCICIYIHICIIHMYVHMHIPAAARSPSAVPPAHCAGARRQPPASPAHMHMHMLTCACACCTIRFVGTRHSTQVYTGLDRYIQVYTGLSIHTTISWYMHANLMVYACLSHGTCMPIS